MNENKKVEILAFINAEWDNYEDKTQMARDIENGYIFGPIGENEHYTIDSIVALIKEVDLEKNPLPEPVVQEDEKLEEVIIEE